MAEEKETHGTNPQRRTEFDYLGPSAEATAERHTRTDTGAELAAKVANKLGARYFNVPAGPYGRMTKAEFWKANKEFLDRTIARNDRILLATDPWKTAPGRSGYRREIEYLLSKGYRISDDGLEMVPG